jgi:hypothetical protein
LTQRFIPTIGQTGFYQFAPPFAVEDTTIQTCKAIRKISELLNESVDVFEEYYAPRGLISDIYDEDVADDAEILFMETSNGRWTMVPSRYLLGYPDMNGVAYQRVSINLTLPAFPVGHDFSHLLPQLLEVIQNAVGTESEAMVITTSKAILVPDSQHQALQAERRVAMSKSTPSSRATYWRNMYDSLKTKFDALVGSVI